MNKFELCLSQAGAWLLLSATTACTSSTSDDPTQSDAGTSATSVLSSRTTSTTAATSSAPAVVTSAASTSSPLSSSDSTAPSPTGDSSASDAATAVDSGGDSASSTSGDSAADAGLDAAGAIDAGGDAAPNAHNPVLLGMAGDFAILAKSAITNVPESVITGDVGVSPAAASYITGFSLIADSSDTFWTSAQVVGNLYGADNAAPTPANLTTAIGDMELAFNDAAGRAPDFTEVGAGDIGGMTLEPGVYKWGTSVLIPSDVTLEGNASDVWIFQIADGLTLSTGVTVLLSGGALPSNIFWEVAGGVALETAAHCEGTVLGRTAITLGTEASVNGRLLAQTAVTLDANTVTSPVE